MSDAKEKLREARKKLREQSKKLRDAEKLANGQPVGEKKRKADYSDHRADAAARSRAKAKSGQEIGPCPRPNMVATINGDWRREACSKSLILHCKTYHAPKFYLSWSKDLIEAAEIMQHVLIYGGRFALAMTRGGGKTTLCRVAVEWGVLNGYRRFISFIGATDPLATKSMRAVKSNIANNDLLLEDYPEVCFPIRCLENNPVRARMQTCDGKPTNIKWSDDEIWFPDVEGSRCAGSIVYCCGITGAVRGPNVVLPNGESLRPDCAIGDDLQTRESAKSPSQTSDRELIIQGDVLELAGPDTEMAFLMPCTVIYPNDLSARFLDRNRYPDFQGKTYKAIYRFPSNTALWDEYAAIRADSMRAGGHGVQATEFYRENREQMDEGAVVAWPDRIKKGDLSALQTAMNVKISKPRTFAAEWQNEPEVADVNLLDAKQLTEEDLIKKLDGRSRGEVRTGCNLVTAFIDMQQEIFYYKVSGWTDRFGGGSVDYGTFPKQPTQVFSAADPPVKLSHLFPKMELKARLIAALNEIVPRLLRAAWRKEDSENSLPISLCLIDAGFMAEAVHEFIRLSPYKALLRASMGKGIGPHKKPMSEYRKGQGDRMGWNWRIDAKPAGKGEYVAFDTNAWKSDVANAILDPTGSASSFHLFGSKIYEHPLLTTHLLAEHRTPTWGQGRRVEVWTMKPGESENHWFDGLVGTAVAASVLGLQWSAATSAGMAEVDSPKPKVDARAEYERKRREFEARRKAMR